MSDGRCDAMVDKRIDKIRESEKRSHTKIYTDENLYSSDSWLRKPINTVREIVPLLADRDSIRVLDLGCGVGRNSIFLAQELNCSVYCVDILDIAIDKLMDNAREYGVANNINGVVDTIERYAISKDSYDLILAVSALEHVENEDSFKDKLIEIRDGIKDKGIVCLIVNSEVHEKDQATGEVLEPQFEVNIPTSKMRGYISDAFRGWTALKETVVPQEYDIPRDDIVSHLTTNVITYVGQK